MKPVYQTTFGDNGNCVSAALASILDLPISAVPTFSQGERRAAEIDAFLAPYGYTWLRASTGPDWRDHVPDVYHTMSGTSPRGRHHMVVGRGGRMVHDPHPNGGGIRDVSYLGFLLPRESTTEADTVSVRQPWRVTVRR